ncbi:hypothetical protein FNO01nite_23380 [Flavobacterium noncentrifugens]|uniref:Por secretion system C-terminal sorting domain-containing protein n=1 Tax=Flavobacterium noncentrifugens TaxID=1128970 RepID=A0A1G9B1A8_9FLAO|nr:choice-of-anchor J domain-containing protein [Flavobacterium noncentrifugens]GEP51666.1 hypothetical protein FNO01nite_23380 [Flavobacterium noncentrifugens]SDK33263.1 Por secretion system C-terminal sorting domain-containing protein [Flavobacterium noncentrifugens]
MKKTLLLLSAVFAIGTAQAQNVYSYDFSGVTADLTTAGFTRTNQSTLASATTLWSIASYLPGVATATNGGQFQNQVYTTGQAYPAPLGQNGVANGFALVNYTSSTSTAATGATLSNWLITPSITVQNGDVVSFYTRVGTFTANGTTSYADRLEFRMSSNGDFTTSPSAGPTDVGDFTALLVTVNPNLLTTANSYPQVWTKYSATISGLNEATSAKFAFRYFVTDGGPVGDNSSLIGIDTFSVDRTLATADFFASNFAVYPNPATNVLNVETKNNTELSQLQLTDINGRIVKEVKASGVSNQINISELNTGVYFLKATSAQGVGTTKIVKN